MINWLKPFQDEQFRCECEISMLRVLKKKKKKKGSYSFRAKYNCKPNIQAIIVQELA